MSLEQTNGKIHILYVYVSNQIQQNKMQPEHVSEAERFNMLMFRSRSPVNRIPLRSRAHIKMFPVTLGIFIFSCL